MTEEKKPPLSMRAVRRIVFQTEADGSITVVLDDTPCISIRNVNSKAEVLHVDHAGTITTRRPAGSETEQSPTETKESLPVGALVWVEEDNTIQRAMKIYRPDEEGNDYVVAAVDLSTRGPNPTVTQHPLEDVVWVNEDTGWAIMANPAPKKYDTVYWHQPTHVPDSQPTMTKGHISKMYGAEAKSEAQLAFGQTRADIKLSSLSWRGDLKAWQWSGRYAPGCEPGSRPARRRG